MKIEQTHYPTVTHQPDDDTIVMLEFREAEVFTVRKGRGLVQGSTRTRYKNAWQSHQLPPRYRTYYSDMKRFYEKRHPEFFHEDCERDNCVLCTKTRPKPQLKAAA